LELISVDLRRVAIIFDHKARPETTGVYCRRALGQLVEVEHFLPAELAQVPRKGFDLYLNVDDGLRYHFPPDLHPSAWWAIDTHMDFAWSLEKARGFDFVFAAQRDGAARLRGEGIATAGWLPLGCDPELHRRHDVAKRFVVAFVGNVFPGPREDLLERIDGRFPNSFVGRAYFEEMARAYSAARVVFNRSVANDVNMRVFEALACGSLLLTNDLGDNGQDELFQDGVHLATYRGPEDLLDKIDYYLRREEIRERIAEAGRSEALGKHTYRQRMEGLLREVESGLSSVIRRAHVRSPDPAVAATAGLASPTAVPWGDLRSSEWQGLETMPQQPWQGLETMPQQPGPETMPQQSPEPRDRSYFEHARPELLAMVPDSARRILDIGCGAGRLGQAIKLRQGAEVVGIERNQEAAQLARERLDRVLVGDVERLEPDFAPGTFDVIVCGDILEHLRDPDRFLRRAREWLGTDGRVVASIPNVRHHSVVRSLLEGNWTYESAGLLDQDHVRFFTRREIEKLFYRAGFSVETLGYVRDPGDEAGGSPGEPRQIQVGRLRLGGLSAAEVEEFHAYQYLVIARPERAPAFGLTSIVILTHDQLAYTRACVDSIRRLTDEPYELIFVDNASSDGTAGYLRGIAGARLIVNAENRGFPAAVNQGIAVARGEQVLLLNNDTVVTTGWLRRMLGALHADPKVGLVGPCSNCVSGPQQVAVGYDALTGLDGFAWDWGKAHDEVREETGRLVGFCLLVRRGVIDAIGNFDERFGIGCFEDDDYCLRAMRAGHRLAIARDAFVHHHGGRTFAGSGVDFASVMRENEQRFRDKWGQELWCDAPGAGERHDGLPMTAAVPAVPPTNSQEFAFEASPNGGLLLNRARVRLSLCMIVRDNSRTIRPCLESIRPWVDEMVIVDTGSTDETPGIVESYGGRLFHFPWCDDFSAARNESFRHARGEWLFWMDSDDTISEDCGRRLRALAYGSADASILGYVMQVHCPGAEVDGSLDMTVVDHVKLIRNRPDLRFEGRIHEQVLPAIRRANGQVAWTELFVVHSGSDQGPDAQSRKRERDLRILHRELAERPEHPFTLFNLGMTYADAGRHAEAADFLSRSIDRSAPHESHVRKAYALLVYALLQLERRPEADATCRRGRALYPEDGELRFRQGILLHDQGRLQEAAEAYRDVLANREGRHFSSVDRGIFGFKARQNLAVVYTELGEAAAAEEQWRLVVREVPRYRAGWHGLCQILFERGTPAEAEPALRELARLAPDDASAHFNLGTLYLRMHRYREAAREYRESIRLRPGRALSYLHLGYALKEDSNLHEAAEAFREVLRLEPGHPTARRELASVEQPVTDRVPALI